MNNKSVILEAIKKNPEMSYKEIGEIFGVTRSRIQKIAKDGGLPSRSGRPKNYRADITAEKVLNLYNNTDISINKIAVTLSCDQQLVRRRLRKVGISGKEVYSRRARILNPQWTKKAK